jgi:hypothetical protein
MAVSTTTNLGQCLRVILQRDGALEKPHLIDTESLRLFAQLYFEFTHSAPGAHLYIVS